MEITSLCDNVIIELEYESADATVDIEVSNVDVELTEDQVAMFRGEKGDSPKYEGQTTDTIEVLVDNENDMVSANLTQSVINTIAQKMDNTRIRINTTEHWSEQTSFVPENGSIIIYSDYKTIQDGGVTKYVAGVKIGDGNAYVVDLPFIDDELRDLVLRHIGDTSVHIQEGERAFWNNKLNYVLDGEVLELNRN